MDAHFGNYYINVSSIVNDEIIRLERVAPTIKTKRRTQQ